MPEKISRKKFFKIFAYLLLIPFGYLMNLMVKDHRKFQSANREFRISDPPPGLSISGPVIISRLDNGINIFSSRCTHLGCQINKIDNDEIICPCHGSRYDKNGNPTNGPSIKALKKLNFTTDETTQEIVIKLN